MRPTAILIVWDRMGDYHQARIKACREIIEGEVYSADLGSADRLYKWNNVSESHHFVLSDKPVQEKDFVHRFKTFRKILNEKKITCIAMGYGRTEYLAFLLYAKLRGIKTIVFCESWYTRGIMKDFLKSCLLKAIGTNYFVSGERAYNHFVHRYHMNPAKVCMGYSVVDNEHFKAKKELPKTYLLCVARYSEEKNLEFLIRCFTQSKLSEKYQLLIIGDGPLKESLQHTITSLHTDRIILSGWRTYAELPEIYAGAIACILPSTFEPWGLVINEAMAAKLPILVSNDCGCKSDLLKEGINGLSFNPANGTELVSVLNRFSEHESLLMNTMGVHSLNIIGNFTPESWAKHIQSFISSMCFISK